MIRRLTVVIATLLALSLCATASAFTGGDRVIVTGGASTYVGKHGEVLTHLKAGGNVVVLDGYATATGIRVYADAELKPEAAAPPPPPADTTAPNTTITTAPADGTATDATVAFASSEAGSTFECRLDGSAWAGCTTPKQYAGLAVGQHTIDIRATDLAGNTDQSPATVTWTIQAPAPAAFPPPAAAFPDASNTGVPLGTIVSPYSGPTTITNANTVIDGKSMGCVVVKAPGVVIRNSRITGSCGYTVYAEDGAFTGAPLTVTDSEISCSTGGVGTATGGTAFGEANITVLRSSIYGCENGFDVNQKVTVEDSYIHDLYNAGEAHTDGMQMAFGHYENGRLVGGAKDVTIRHNTIYGMGADGSFGTSAIISNRGPQIDTNVLIENNLLAGGAVALYCEQTATGSNYRVIGNHFSTRFGPQVGAYGPSTDCSDETQSGNVWHESGAALTLG